MAVVSVKNKFQVVIPQDVREQVQVRVGDLLEAKVQGGNIVLIPKTLIDRRIAEGLEDLRRGRTHGPYLNASDAIKALDGRATAQVKKRKR
jgi:AbrB family looped-hinge helix DNA binding protein